MVVLSSGLIPTVDFYVTPRLRNVPAESIFRFDSRCLDDAAGNLPGGSFVVIVRHASRAWLNFLERNRSRWCGVAFLMDDDIPGAWSCADVPRDYGLWTSGRYWLARRGLSRVCDRIWMSTEPLRERYSQVESTRVPPLAFAPTRSPAPAGTRRWGYHGTRIHQRELHWLVAVVEAVQQAVPEAEFEVFGNRRVEELFASIPRVTVLPPRPWPDYVTHCHNSNLAVGLAPVLPGRFNAMRAYTKLFDITNCGAVGVYSRKTPYAPLLADTGAELLPDDQSAWARAVIQLLEDDEARLAGYRQANEWIDAVCRQGDLAELLEDRDSE